MTKYRTLANACLVLPAEVIHGALVVRGRIITRITQGQQRAQIGGRL